VAPIILNKCSAFIFKGKDIWEEWQTQLQPRCDHKANRQKDGEQKVVCGWVLGEQTDGKGD
jgi:hypothetical protein